MTQTPPTVTYLQLEQALGSGAPVLAGWVAANVGETLIANTASYLGAVVDRGFIEQPALELLQWWLEANQGTMATRQAAAAAVRASGAVPQDITQVISYASNMTGSSVLSTYSDALLAEQQRQDAMRALARRSQAYPSLGPVVDALKRYDAELATRRLPMLPGGWDSAAWQEGREDINRAIQATRAVKVQDPPVCRLPGTWLTGSSHDRCAAGLVSSLVPRRERTKILGELRKELARALSTLARRDRAEVEAWLISVDAVVDSLDDASRPIRGRVRLRRVDTAKPHR